MNYGETEVSHNTTQHEKISWVVDNEVVIETSVHHEGTKEKTILSLPDASILDNEEKTPQKIKDGGGGGIENSMILHNGKEQYYQSRKDVAKRIALRAKYLEDNTGYGDEEEDIYSSSHSTAENTALIAEMPHVTKQPSFQVPTTSNASKIILIRNVNNRTVPILLAKQTQPASTIFTQPPIRTIALSSPLSTNQKINSPDIDYSYEKLKTELTEKINQNKRKKMENIDPLILEHVKNLQRTTYLKRRQLIKAHQSLSLEDKVKLYPELLSEATV
ncbi:unnamed protein product [Didymodactylos carnosus]|nr:unnamed protein product [Didymodactylos carnosus]CAF3993417.1 unnamed protein product [Didymodactylos carnosus]